MEINKPPHHPTTPSPHYFSLLGMQVSFLIDEKALESAYFAAQRQYHPDRFVGKPAPERLAAMQQSADINKAYETLKNPLKRAQYLLHLRGITVGTEQDSVKPSAALLVETMELRERIAEAKNTETLQTLAGDLEKMRARSLKILANNYMYAQWNEMAQETLRLGYIMKAQEAVILRLGKAESAGTHAIDRGPVQPLRVSQDDKL